MDCDDSVVEVSFAGDGATPGMAVIQAVAESEGVHVIDLPPLYEAVPSSVIDTLFEEDIQVGFEFTYNGYEVAVLRDERVRVQKME